MNFILGLVVGLGSGIAIGQFLDSSQDVNDKSNKGDDNGNQDAPSLDPESSDRIGNAPKSRWGDYGQ